MVLRVPSAASGEKESRPPSHEAAAPTIRKADLFEYYPPIQERVRWIIGAKI